MAAFSQAYSRWLHACYRRTLDAPAPAAKFNTAVSTDFVTIGFVEMEGEEVSVYSARYALLPSAANPRRARLVAVSLFSNHSRETRFVRTAIVGCMLYRKRRGINPYKARGCMKRRSRGCQKRKSHGCNKRKSRRCMPYQCPIRKLAARHAPAVLSPCVVGSHCTNWVFFAPPERTELALEAAKTPEPLVEAPCDADANPRPVKEPRQERASNDTVISFLC